MNEEHDFVLLSDSESVDPAILLNTALRACEAHARNVVRHPLATSHQDVASAYREAADEGRIVVHTLLNSDLRKAALFFSRRLGVPSIDLLGPVIVRLTDLLSIPPRGREQLFQPITEDYFRRIEAIEFAVAHDDGLRPFDLDRAEIVLTGVSRTSKTPLSMYLASHGWLVGNVPLVAGQEPPPRIMEIDPHKVFALSITAERLAMLRQVRLTRLGLNAPPEYADLEYIRNELVYAREVFRRGGWTVVDVTSKSIEESASEIVSLLNESVESRH